MRREYLDRERGDAADVVVLKEVIEVRRKNKLRPFCWSTSDGRKHASLADAFYHMGRNLLTDLLQICRRPFCTLIELRKVDDVSCPVYYPPSIGILGILWTEYAGKEDEK